MRKHKSVVAILLAVMMIFTFMPAMAFANTQTTHGVWNDNFTQYQIGGEGAWYNVPESAVETNQWTGMKTATYNGDSVYYYDFKDARVSADDDMGGGNISWSNYNALVSDGVAFKIYPRRATQRFNSWDYNAFSGTNWTAKVTGEKIEEDFVGNKSVTLPVSFSATGSEVAGTTTSTPALLNAEGMTLTLNVIGTKTATNIWVVDGIEPGKDGYVDPTTHALAYTGAEHTITLKDFDGYTAEYQKFDTSKAAWVKTDAITIKDAAKTYTQYRARLVKNGTTTGTAYATVKPEIAKSAAPEFQFDEFDYPKDSNYADGYKLTPGAIYNPTEFIVVKTGLVKGSAGYKANVAAIKANSDELLAYFNDFYTVEKTTKKSEPNKEYLTIEEKDLTTAEKTALNKKYEQLLLNFETPEVTTTGNYEATVYFVGKTVYDNIDITAVSKVTYKKVKKNKTISVKAVADSGNAVSFKLLDAPSKIKINKTTGKITVKKGLKKGTYKFIVKATTENDESKYTVGATEYHTIKVVVKK